MSSLPSARSEQMEVLVKALSNDVRRLRERLEELAAEVDSQGESRIVRAMLSRAAALEAGDEQAAAQALVEAGEAAELVRKQRRGEP